MTSQPKQALGSSTRPSHTSGSFAGWSVAPKGRPLGRGDSWIERSRNGVCRGSKRKKSSSKLVNYALGRTNFFPALDRGRAVCIPTCHRRSAGPRLGAGSRARRANARGLMPQARLPATSLRSYPSPLSPVQAGKGRRMGVPGRAVLRRAGGCGRPVCPVLGGEDGALARRPQAPLDGQATTHT